MQNEAYEIELDFMEIALRCSALFEQYDETDAIAAANDEIYDNLYPTPA